MHRRAIIVETAVIEFIEQNLLPPTFSFGDDVFEWLFCQTREGLTMWKLSFYRSVVFYAIAAEDAASLIAELNADAAGR